MAISFGFYALMTLGNVKFFKQKEYPHLKTKSACTGAKHHWCKKNGVSPNTFWFFLLSLGLFFAALVYGVVGAIQCSQGQDFRYWLVGDWVRGTITE